MPRFCAFVRSTDAGQGPGRVVSEVIRQAFETRVAKVDSVERRIERSSQALARPALPHVQSL